MTRTTLLLFILLVLTAAVALADRLREAGRFAMACYYYDLVLTERPDSRIDATGLRAQALRCAKGCSGLWS